ncbi:MAG: DUF3408 domain-containing protein [Dysgonamonadaceae bacterium]|jgi:hypothetical protein|nr:DUF3408 domain-containing protein [Dysgonamonadaceae bacterium]
MENNKRKSRAVEDIDEAALLQSVYEQSNPSAVSVPPKESEKQIEPVPEPEQPKEENRTKRGGRKEYESLFIRESNLPPARFGKSVYIRKEYHDRISQIISVIGSNEVSLFGYIDNVLTHHFESFGDDIIQSFKKNVFFK